jgi:hypothetical protein
MFCLIVGFIVVSESYDLNKMCWKYWRHTSKKIMNELHYCIEISQSGYLAEETQTCDASM